MEQTQNTTQKLPYEHLSFEERQLIEVCHNKGASNREIGKRLGWHHQTINNELKRGTTTQIKENNKSRQLYFAETGQASFSKIFQSITAGNGSEFSSLHDALQQITDVYFAHPYSFWERGTNERHNGLLRQFVPKGTTICHYSKQFIQLATEKINLLPRKILNYRQPATLFLEEILKLKIKTCW